MYCKTLKRYLEKKNSQKTITYKGGPFGTMLLSTLCFFSVGTAFDSGAARPLYTHLWPEAEGWGGEESTESKALRAGCLSGSDNAIHFKSASFNRVINDC